MVVITSDWGWEVRERNNSGGRKQTLWNCLLFLKVYAYAYTRTHTSVKHPHLMYAYAYF